MGTASAALAGTRRGQQMHTPAPAQGLCLPGAVHDAVASPCAPVAAPSRRHGCLGTLGDTLAIRGGMGGFLWDRHLRGRLARQYSIATRLLRTLMRHLLLRLPLAIPRLAPGVCRSARPAALVARSAASLRRPARLRAAHPSAVALAAVARPAHHHFGLASPACEHSGQTPAIPRFRWHRRPRPDAPRARACGLALLACSPAIAGQPVPYSSRTRGSPAGLTRWGAAVGTTAKSLRPPRPFLQLRCSTASSPSAVAQARLLLRRFAPGGWGTPPVPALVLHDSQRQRSVHRWMMLAGLGPPRPPAVAARHQCLPPCHVPCMASALPLTLNRLAFAGSVLLSRGGSIRVSAKVLSGT
jgi:hypothetical protein